MGQFNAIAKSIRDVVIPEPDVDEDEADLSDSGESYQWIYPKTLQNS